MALLAVLLAGSLSLGRCLPPGSPGGEHQTASAWGLSAFGGALVTTLSRALVGFPGLCFIALLLHDFPGTGSSLYAPLPCLPGSEHLPPSSASQHLSSRLRSFPAQDSCSCIFSLFFPPVRALLLPLVPFSFCHVPAFHGTILQPFSLWVLALLSLPSDPSICLLLLDSAACLPTQLNPRFLLADLSRELFFPLKLMSTMGNHEVAGRVLCPLPLTAWEYYCALAEFGTN